MINLKNVATDSVFGPHVVCINKCILRIIKNKSAIPLYPQAMKKNSYYVANSLSSFPLFNSL